MVSVPLGIGAFKRSFSGEPEIKLVNRFVEKDPTNLREHIALLSRPGTASLAQFAGGNIRGCYAKAGLFGDDLFVVSGANLYRYASDGTLTHITGTVAGTGFVYITWMKGTGYEFLFLSDGATLQYYTTHALGVLTLTLAALDGNITNQVLEINGTYYSWSATVDPGTPPDGTSAQPYLALLGTAAPAGGVTADADSLANMAKLLNFDGIPGFDFSSSVTGPNAAVTATSNAASLTATAIADDTAGNAITTTVFSGSGLAWGAVTLAGGGGSALQSVALPDGTPRALAAVSSYVLVSIANSQRFYWLNPGEVVIDALNFASKESNPDSIVDMHTLGDQVIITGEGSTENWYATGDLAAPFAPQQGRVYRRGAIAGTPVVVQDSLILVGDDGIVYQIGYSGSESQWGVHRISNNGIEERVRSHLRQVQSLAP